MATTPRRRADTRTSRLARIGANVAIVAVMLVALGFLVPALLGFQRYVITSGSMTGTYDTGSVVFSEVVPTSELRVGDVITYVPPAETGINHLVTHRIVAIDGDELRTKGDASPQVDPWTFQLTAAEQPRAVAGVPYVGYLFLALADRATRIVVIGVPAALIALLALAELVRGLRPERPATDSPAVPVLVPTIPAARERAAVSTGRARTATTAADAARRADAAVLAAATAVRPRTPELVEPTAGSSSAV